MKQYIMGLYLALVVSLVLWAGPTEAEPVRIGPAEVELVADRAGFAPGEKLRLGLRIKPDDEWHVYWSNPGDAGLPPTLKWSAPDGFVFSEIEYPAPDLIPSGPLAAYGYHGEALYPVTVIVPEQLKSGNSITIGVEATWLICKEECLPGKVTLSLKLPVVGDGSAQPSRWSGLFEQAQKQTPIPLPDGWSVSASASPEQDRLLLDFNLVESAVSLSEIKFFALEKNVIAHAAPQAVSPTDDGFRLTLKRSSYSQGLPERLIGVLAVTERGQIGYYRIDVPVKANSHANVASSGSSTSLWLALLLAFAGGLILNLMPCVLPVLSLKVLGLVGQAGEGRRSLFMHGLSFSMGIVATFWALVIVMFLLQAGGTQLGWGFQLQSPVFVMVMAGFIFLLALNMFGVFEISFLSGLTGGGGSGARGGLSGAFLSGITATLLATPCTAPFMGTALGYSLTQPPVVSSLIYTALGVGMASPYLVLTSFPSLLKLMPKPGRWIETLKQALGFVLIATVIWLAWVLSLQTGSSGLLTLNGVLLLIGIAAWIYGRWSLATSKKAIATSRSLALVLLIGSILLGGKIVSSTEPDISDRQTTNQAGLDWNEFSQPTLDSLLSAGRPVFVDFTAAWCLSCQVNEKVALDIESVRSRFASLDITLLKADWTRRSPEITSALARFGRNSVPLYLLYVPNSPDPIILPEILTTGIVHDALDKIENETSNLKI